MKTVLLALAITTTPARAARPDRPITDVNAHACREALAIPPGESRTIDVYAKKTRLVQPEWAEFIVHDREDRGRHTLTVIRQKYARLKDDGLRYGAFLVNDDEIETRSLGAVPYALFLTENERVGTAKLDIRSLENRPPPYEGRNALVPGDVFRADDALWLVFFAHPSRRWDHDEGDLSATTYLVLPLGPTAEVGRSIDRRELVPHTIEEYSYAPQPEPVVLVGHAELEGGFELAGALSFEGRLTKFTPRESEPETLVRLLIGPYRPYDVAPRRR